MGTVAAAAAGWERFCTRTSSATTKRPHHTSRGPSRSSRRPGDIKPEAAAAAALVVVSVAARPLLLLPLPPFRLPLPRRTPSHLPLLPCLLFLPHHRPMPHLPPRFLHPSLFPSLLPPTLALYPRRPLRRRHPPGSPSAYLRGNRDGRPRRRQRSRPRPHGRCCPPARFTAAMAEPLRRCSRRRRHR